MPICWRPVIVAKIETAIAVSNLPELIIYAAGKQSFGVRRSTTFIWIVNSIFWLAGMLEILLGIRFLLRLFGANPQNEFARLINNLSAPFIAPFSTLFISPTSGGGANIFDINIVIAIVVYALLSYLVVSLVRFIFYHKL